MARTKTPRFKAGNNSMRTTYVISGGVVDVNASNDFMDIALNRNPNSNWTIAHLIYPLHDGTLYNQSIHAQNNGAGVGRGYMTSPLVGQFFSSALGGGVSRNSTQKPVLNTWQWLVYTNSYAAGLNTLNMYWMPKNGYAAKTIGTFAGITYENADGNHRIGAGKNDTSTTGTGTRCFDGYYGHTKILSATLTQVQVTNLCTKNQFNQADLLREYNYSESSGTSVADTSGNNDNGVLLNGAAINTDQAFVPWRDRLKIVRTKITRTKI